MGASEHAQTGSAVKPAKTLAQTPNRQTEGAHSPVHSSSFFSSSAHMITMRPSFKAAELIH